MRDAWRGRGVGVGRWRSGQGGGGRRLDALDGVLQGGHTPGSSRRNAACSTRGRHREGDVRGRRPVGTLTLVLQGLTLRRGSVVRRPLRIMFMKGLHLTLKIPTSSRPSSIFTSGWDRKWTILVTSGQRRRFPVGGVDHKTQVLYVGDGQTQDPLLGDAPRAVGDGW